MQVGTRDVGFVTTQQQRENDLLDFALEHAKKTREAIDYINIVMALPLGTEEHQHLGEIKRILGGEGEAW